MCTKLTRLFSLVLLSVAVGTARADLVSHWMLDEGSGTTAYDSGPGGNDGTLQDNPALDDPIWIAGVSGGALEFHGTGVNGTGGDYIDCGNDASLDIAGPISIALWIRPDADDPEGKGAAGGETAPMAKALSPDWSWQVRYGWYSPTPYMAFTFNTSPRAWVYVGRNLERYEWAHIACSHDGATLKCYLNGEETDSTPMGAITSSPAPVLIGSDGWGSDWTGAIDDVRIYDHGISEGELHAAMATEPLVSAYAPNPKDGAMIDTTQATLGWQAGEKAALHEVYFGESFDAVSAATPDDGDIFVGRRPTTLISVGAAGAPYPEGLVPGTTYYWRIDEINDAEPNSPWKGPVWSFQVRPVTAWGCYPPDGMKYVDPDQGLSWQAGMGTAFHTIYFGDSFEEARDTMVGGIATANPTYNPPTPFLLDTTYYWRVDEFAYPANKTYKGEVWSFTTRGEGGGAKAEYFSGMGLAGDPVLTQVEGTIDHQWGEAEVAPGLVDLASARWTASLEVPFTETYRLITTSDDGVRLWLDGRLIINNWTDHGTVDNVASVDLIAGQLYSIRMEWYENTGGAVAQLSWDSPSLDRQIIPQGWLQLPVRASSPSPAHGTPHADQASMLTWNAGDDATAHNVYFGDDADAVANADTTTTGIYRGQQEASETSFNPGGLEWGKTYYWRIDEVNPDGTLAGAVWSFTAADFIVVDDFESYTDDNLAYEAVFQTWLDGFGYTEPEDVMGNGTGSTVGNMEPPFAEQTVVHSGYQSMPLDYNNVISPYYSEAERTWNVGQNWTVNGVDTLTVYFRGGAGNGPDTLYVALQDSAGRVAAVPNPNPDAVLATDWTEWPIPLTDFTGVNTAGIKKMYIGLGNRNSPMPGGAGLIYIDDVRVTKAASSE